MTPTPARPASPDRSPAPPADESTWLDADRWRLWRTLARGLAHGLANAAQMLALDPVPPRARLEALERVETALARLDEVHRAAPAAPALVSEVLADVQALQRLQAGFPSIELAVEAAPGLPAVAIGAADLSHALLGLVTDLRAAAGDTRPAIALRAFRAGDGVAVEVTGGPPPDAAPGLAVARALARRAGGDAVVDGAAVRLRLPAWPAAR